MPTNNEPSLSNLHGRLREIRALLELVEEAVPAASRQSFALAAIGSLLDSALAELEILERVAGQ